jgi:hypothetical protein
MTDHNQFRRPLPDALQRANAAVDAQIATGTTASGDDPSTTLPTPHIPPSPPLPAAPLPEVTVPGSVENRLQAALGQLRALQERANNLASVNATLAAQIVDLRAQVAQPRPEAPPAAPPAAPPPRFELPERFFDDETRAELGEGLAAKLERNIKGVLTSAVGPVVERAQQDAEAAITANAERDAKSWKSEVLSAIPDIMALNAMPEFQAWIQSPDADGITPLLRMNRAGEGRNLDRLVDLYREARSAIGVADPSPNGEALPNAYEAPTGPAARQPLAQRVAPSSVMGTPPSAPAEPRIKLSDIRALQNKLTREAANLSPARRAELKASLNAMQAIQATRPDLVIND